jgi:hypothetical protein
MSKKKVNLGSPFLESHFYFRLDVERRTASFGSNWWMMSLVSSPHSFSAKWAD